MKTAIDPVIAYPFQKKISTDCYLPDGPKSNKTDLQPCIIQPRNQHILKNEGIRSPHGIPHEYEYAKEMNGWVNGTPYPSGIARSIIFSDWKNHA